MDTMKPAKREREPLTETITFRVEGSISAALRRVADGLDRTLGWVIRQACVRSLGGELPPGMEDNLADDDRETDHRKGKGGK